MGAVAPTPPAPVLPDAYQQVEYIGSLSTATAGPSFATGIRPPNTGELILECDFMATSYYNTSQSGYPIGNSSSTSENTVGTGIYLPGATASRKNIGIYNGASVLVDTGVSTQVNVRRFAKATFRADGFEKLEVDNQLVAEGTTAAGSLRTRTGYMTLFGIRKGSGSQLTQYFRGRIYRAKVFLDGVLVADMIPCYRKSDNAPGFYELVSEIFHGRTGSGTATVGPDVT